MLGPAGVPLCPVEVGQHSCSQQAVTEHLSGEAVLTGEQLGEGEGGGVLGCRRL